MLLDKEVNDNGVSLYRNSVGTSRYLTRGKKASLISVVKMQEAFLLQMLDKLPHLIKTGRSKMNIQKEMNGNDVEDKTNYGDVDNNTKREMAQNLQNTNSTKMMPGPDKLSPDFQMKFIAVMDSLAAPSAPSLVKSFDLSPHKEAVDLGGGSGRVSIELAKAYPDMKVALFDLPPVIQIAQKFNASQQMKNMTYIGGDFMAGDFPRADLYVLAHVIHGFENEQIDTLLKKVYKRLSPGGSVLIMEKVLTEEKDGPDLGITNDLVISLMSQGRERTGAEYNSLLCRHGFRNVVIRHIEGYNYYDAVMAKKPF
ncbi:hypothetical protein ScPMuIL_017577 [Solemya velum]